MMTTEEIAELKERWYRIEAGGNDGADIYDYSMLCQAMYDKYGSSVELEIAKLETTGYDSQRIS